jgi:hypothetical protein
LASRARQPSTVARALSVAAYQNQLQPPNKAATRSSIDMYRQYVRRAG